MKLNGWDHALKVTATGKGLVGHAGAILLRKAADVTGLTSLLSGALEEKGKSPLLDRGTVLVLTAAAIALGATSMSDVALLRHLPPLWAAGPAARPPAAPWSRQGQSGPWTGSPAPGRKPGHARGSSSRPPRRDSPGWRSRRRR
jgi:hypothetical protein